MKIIIGWTLLLWAGGVFAGDAVDHGETMTGYDSRFVKSSGRIYTATDPAATGGLTGTLPVGELTHALAVDSTRVRVYRTPVQAGGNQFHFEQLPIGKYDVVLITKDRRMFEGVRLGDPITSLPAASRMNLETRIAKADAFFNRYKIHRCGMAGERLLALVERLRDQPIMQQSGEGLNANVRRLEIIELTQAVDNWQMDETRHLYREAEPVEKSPPFFRSVFVPELSGIRIVNFVKELGVIPVPKD